MCSALHGQERELPQGCSCKAEYIRTKTTLVMRVFGLLETFEITNKHFHQLDSDLNFERETNL